MRIRCIVCVATLAVALAGLVPVASAQPAANPQPEAVATPAPMPLHQAVKENKVSVEVTSLGGATGGTVKVNVQRKVPEQLQISIAPGTVFIAVNGRVQNMTGATIKGEFIGQTNTYQPGSVMVLADGARHSFLVESFCLDYHKPAPKRGDTFSLSMLDPRTTRILVPPKGLAPSQWAYQAAIWMDRSGVSANELKQKYHYSDGDVQVAVQLLRHAEQQGVASIPGTIPTDVRVQLQKVFATDPATRAQAIEGLAKLGDRAAAAASIVAVNVVHDAPGNAASTQVSVTANPQEALAALESINLPVVRAWAEAMRAGPPGLPLGPGRLAPRTGPPAGVLPGGVVPAGALEAAGQIRGMVLDRWLVQLKGENVLQRRYAASMLAASRQTKAIEALIDALADSDAGVRDNAAGSLQRMTGQNHGADQAKWRAWWEENKRNFSTGG